MVSKNTAGRSDAFGHELWDFCKGGCDVIKMDDGHATRLNAASGMHFSPLKDWPEVEH